MDRKVKLRSGSDVELVDFMGGDRKVAMSAKVSYGKDQDDRLNDDSHVKGLVNFLLRERHMSPFESSVFTFRVTTPIFVSREIVRHRSSAFSEISGRYSAWDFEFYVPNVYRPLVQQGRAGDYKFTCGTSDQYARVVKGFESSYQKSLDTYHDLLDSGVAKEVARDVLPSGLYTHLYVTVSARNLMHFLGLRGDANDGALYEIKEVANQMETHLRDKMPYTYAAWKEHHG